MMNEGLQEQARESRREISFACDAIMYEQYVILYYNVGPTCWGRSSHVILYYNVEHTHRLAQALADSLEARQYNT